ncbi:M10 family metallopeptidase [Loktanella sp. DJP18]|uniref:M10 family metallopeptidase n=1 Tax=Loktanella sp. DJP18 TaxID=3409788 RepID=UPI003BB6A473
MTSAGQAAAREALKTWTDASGIKFQEVTSGAQINFDDNQSGAYSSSIVSGGKILSSTINVATNFATGDYVKQTYIHEIGHALGLGHAGNYNFTGSFETDATYANDTWQYSIMSYFHQGQSPTSTATPMYLDTPMMADMYAIQQIYGTPTTTRAGDTVYGNDAADTSNLSLEITKARVIVDSGGDDTIDLSSRNFAQNLNLNAGTFSDINGYKGNLGIAVGTTIENAKTGNGSDTITGNAADNHIITNGGNDKIYGGGGKDIIEGGAGSDLINGGDGDDTVIFTGTASTYTIAQTTDGYLVKGADGTDTVLHVENFRFNDATFTSADATAAFKALGTVGSVNLTALLDQIDILSQPVPEPTPEPTPTPQPEPTPEPQPAPAPAPKAPVAAMEVGTSAITLEQSGQWVHIAFDDTIPDAVVVLGPMSSNGGDSGVLEVRNVTDTGFDVRLSEWRYLDGVHIDESFSWMAGTAGSHQMADGSKIFFGEQAIAGGSHTRINVSGFDATPIILGTLSGGDDATLTHRMGGVTTDGFNVLMQAEEGLASSVNGANRTFSYVAIEPAKNGDMATGSLSLTDQRQTLTGVNAGDALFADMQTFNGADTATVRYANYAGVLQLRVAEEQSKDTEIAHGAERVNWISLDQGRQVFGAPAAAVAPATPTDAATPTMQVGTLSIDRLDSDGWRHVTFDKHIENAVVVAGPMSTFGGDDAVVEIRNVTDTGFDVRISEWDFADGLHGKETFSWMAGSAGAHTMEDGTRITFGQTDIHGGDVERIDISGYGSAPVFLGTLEGEGNYTLTHRFNGATADGINVSMQSEELRGTMFETENRTFNWVAIDGGTSGMVEDGTVSLDHTAKTVTQRDKGEAFFADMQTLNGGDTSSIRYFVDAFGKIAISVREEKSADAEVLHGKETVKWLTFDEGLYNLNPQAAATQATGSSDEFSFITMTEPMDEHDGHSCLDHAEGYQDPGLNIVSLRADGNISMYFELLSSNFDSHDAFAFV